MDRTIPDRHRTLSMEKKNMKSRKSNKYADKDGGVNSTT